MKQKLEKVKEALEDKQMIDVVLALTLLSEVLGELESPELEERIAAEIRVQDIGQPSDLCTPHEYLDGSRVLAKAAIKIITGKE